MMVIGFIIDYQDPCHISNKYDCIYHLLLNNYKFHGSNVNAH